jgi:hypothetical protein
LTSATSPTRVLQEQSSAGEADSEGTIIPQGDCCAVTALATAQVACLLRIAQVNRRQVCLAASGAQPALRTWLRVR